METILLLKRILSGINLVALAIRTTHILRFTTHSWRSELKFSISGTITASEK